MKKIKLIGVFIGLMFMSAMGYSQAGSTFSNPAVVASLPYSATGETNCGFGDNYTTADIGCTGSYMSGDEKIYSFTPNVSYSSVDITLSNISQTWSGLYVTDDSTTTGNCVGKSEGSTTADKTITGLSLVSGTTYYIIVSTYATPQCITSYDLAINAITCPAPTALGVSGVTLTSATLSWTEAGTATNWEIETGTPGFTQGTGTMTSVSSYPYTLTGLTAATSYDYYVRSGCGANDSSLWSGPYTIYTGYCTPAPTSVDGTGITNVSMDTVDNTTVAEAGNYGDYSAMVANFTWSADMMFDIDITKSNTYGYYMHTWVDWNDDLDFDDVGEHYYLGQTPTSNPGTLNGAIKVPVSATAGIHRLRIGGFWSSSFSSTADPCYAGSWASFEDYSLNIGTPPSCITTDSMSVANITSSSADLAWVELGSASNWKVEYGAPGFVSGTGDTVLTTSNPHTLSGLSALTNYEYYVRAVCSAGDSSFWNGPFGFTTDCTGPLSGTYTMDANSAASATNFISMEDFAQALDICGLGGATVLNVVNNGDTLMGPWDLGSITGSSATNTLTVNGNNNLVHKNTSSNHFVRMEGTSFVTIDGFNFENQTPNTAVFGIQLKDSCTNISITNNMINLGMGYTSSASGGVIASNSITSATTAGDNAYNLTISNNEIIGGYYGMSLFGGGLSGCVISNNNVHDFYQYGILVRNSDSNVFENNNIHRAMRTTISSFYGMRIGVSTRAIVRGNKIHDSGSGSYTCYALEMQGAPNTMVAESHVYNNQIYNLGSTSSTYGITLSNATVRYMKVHHNTVVLDAGGTGLKRGLYYNTNMDSNTVQNNMVVISGAGTGIKTGVYNNNAANPMASDFNVVHVSGAGTLYFGRSSSTYRNTLADWQTATSLDAASLESDPYLVDPANGDLTPLSIPTDNLGTPVSYITMDANGATRSGTTPDAGAIEYTGIPGDLALSNTMLAQVDACYGSADSAFATVSNILPTTSDFAANPLTIVWNVTGPVNTTDSLVVNTGSLLGNADSTFSIGSIDMSVPGDYWVSSYIKPNAVNPIASNDSIMNGYVETVVPVLSVTPDSSMVTSPFDSVEITAQSPFAPYLPGVYKITERCQWAAATNGLPVSGRPSWLTADDYIEITGAPGSDLDGFTYEMWTGTTVASTTVFAAGTLLSPEGTAIIGSYQGTASPSDYFYLTSTSNSTGSSTASGHILKDASGTIIDAVGYGTYSFPVGSGVTAADWSGTQPGSGSTWGIRLEGPDMNDNTGWVSTTGNAYRQDPNVLNNGYDIPKATNIAGLTWDSAGVNVGTTNVTLMAGTFTTDGVYSYIATFTNACGTFMDTSVVTVDLTKAMMSDSTHVQCNGADDGTATVTASGGDSPYTYLWSNGDITAMADSLAPGVHTVTVYDANMWPATAMVTITEPTALAATTSTTSSTCGVPSGSATVSVTGGTTPYSYVWSDGQTTAIASGLVGGGYTVTVTDTNMCEFIVGATVSDIGAPAISMAVDSIVACYGESTGVVTASATGGSTPYAFAWSSGGTAATENGLAVGTYDVTLTDASGCVASESVSMTQNSQLLAIISGNTNPLCNGDATGTAMSVAGGGVSPYSYAWSNGDMVANASNLAAGSHTLTVTDAVGCMQTTSVIVTQPNALSGTFVNVMDVSCNAGTNGSAGMLNAGGTAPYTMAWSDGSTAGSTSGLSAGYVSVMVTDANGCMMTDSVEIMEPTALSSTASVVSDVLCNGGNSGQASVTAAGGVMPHVYAWSNGAGGSSANSLAAGSYTVTVSDGNNCQTTSNVTVTEPTMLMSTVTGTDISCNGMNDGAVSSVSTGGTSPYIQVWSNGSTAASQSNVMMGSYSVVVTDANGCTVSGMANVVEPAAVVVNLGGNGSLCDGESMVLDAGASITTYTYVWSTGGTNQMDTVTATGLGAGVSTVGVMVTDAGGCMGADSVMITVSNPVTTTISGDAELCAYENGVLDAGPGFASYTWDNTSSSQTVNVNASTLSAGSHVYNVVVADANGCEGTASHAIEIHPEVIVTLPADTVIWKDSTITIMADSGYATYFWNTGVFTQSIEVSTPGTYEVVVTDPTTGCEGSDEIVVDFALDVTNASSAQLKLYPNPAVDFINLEFNNFPNQGTVQVDILSITGQLVRTIQVDVSGVSGTQSMDVSNLAVGTYMVTFQYDDQRIVEKFTIK